MWHLDCSTADMVEPSPLPLAIVMSSFEPGGTEQQMIELVRRLDRSRWDVHVACLRERGAWLSRARAAASCTTFAMSSFRSASTLAAFRAFVAWCRERRFAVVQAADALANVFGLTGAALAGVPVRIGTRRDVNPGRTLFELSVQRAGYACAHKIVANARAAADRLTYERVPAAKVAVVANGLDLARFRARPRTPPLRRVVTVANLRPEKGQEVLIAAAPRVARAFPDAHFTFVGDGTERARLQAIVSSAGLDGVITFHGHADDVAPHLEAADIFVLPSRTEAFPNALLEAMAMGLPVVASAVGGILEIVDHGRTGFLAPAGDSTALADRLIALMSDGETGVRAGEAARRDVEARFSFERMVGGYERIYLTELARCGLVQPAHVQLAVS